MGTSRTISDELPKFSDHFSIEFIPILSAYRRSGRLVSADLPLVNLIIEFEAYVEVATLDTESFSEGN